MSSTPIRRIFVVDDHLFFRSGVKAWIEAQPDLACCGEAADVATARALLAAAQPDVVLLDLGLPDQDGQSFLAEAQRLAPQARFIVLSQRDETVFAQRVVKAGARAYLMKSEASEVLREAIDAVLAGSIYLSRTAAATAAENPAVPGLQRSPDLASLSDRELQVFGLIGAGRGPKEIAAQLLISPKTVETYRANLKSKLGLESSALLAQKAAHWLQYGTLKPTERKTGG